MEFSSLEGLVRVNKKRRLKEKGEATVVELVLPFQKGGGKK